MRGDHRLQCEVKKKASAVTAYHLLSIQCSILTPSLPVISLTLITAKTAVLPGPNNPTQRRSEEVLAAKANSRGYPARAWRDLKGFRGVYHFVYECGVSW